MSNLTLIMRISALRVCIKDQRTLKKFEIPALKNWMCIFMIPPTGIDGKGQTLSINHAPFENLVDANN